MSPPESIKHGFTYAPNISSTNSSPTFQKSKLSPTEEDKVPPPVDHYSIPGQPSYSHTRPNLHPSPSYQQLSPLHISRNVENTNINRQHQQQLQQTPPMSAPSQILPHQTQILAGGMQQHPPNYGLSLSPPVFYYNQQQIPPYSQIPILHNQNLHNPPLQSLPNPLIQNMPNSLQPQYGYYPPQFPGHETMQPLGPPVGPYYSMMYNPMSSILQQRRKSKQSTTWSPKEDKLLRELKEVQKLGWREISTFFQDRTPNACQFRWRRIINGTLTTPASSTTAFENGKKKSHHSINFLLN